ncbi:MAG: hypothetical protein KC731_35885 [Myxococcales bacterium]|nr:hypothetical protein [Myxococcales bacterium]
MDIELLVADAGVLFEEARLDALARWSRLELEGYGDQTDARRLREILGVGADDRLVAHVAAYRVQHGVVVDESGARLGKHAHFFVENVRDLITARNRIHHGNVQGTLVLERAWERF